VSEMGENVKKSRKQDDFGANRNGGYLPGCGELMGRFSGEKYGGEGCKWFLEDWRTS